MSVSMLYLSIQVARRPRILLLGDLPEPENGDPATADPPQKEELPSKSGRLTSNRPRMSRNPRPKCL
jgi:hypothetical protein